MIAARMTSRPMRVRGTQQPTLRRQCVGRRPPYRVVMPRLPRRSSVRLALILTAAALLLLYVYFARVHVVGPRGIQDQDDAVPAPLPLLLLPTTDEDDREEWRSRDQEQAPEQQHDSSSISKDASCPRMLSAKVDYDTAAMYPALEFNPRFREYWDENFERRYQHRRSKWKELPLEVVVVPHSHNDPGWLKTFDDYFHSQTSYILDNMVDKLQEYSNMTFIWSEVSLLAKWWQGAHHRRRKAVLDLLKSGRLEIVTGGWVMTDEATVNLYSMLEQLIEGHQWLKHNLNYTAQHGWSVDPFGHGASVPYLLKNSGISATTIQRIHFAWKQRLAELQGSDFRWRQLWDPDGLNDILVHNLPFDIYSIKHSCGPHPQVCLTYDFRKIRGEFTEYSVRAQPVTQWNLKERAETLLAEYGRTASLYPHNVAMIPLGDDFRFDHALEWDQQYRNYETLFDYINSRPKDYSHAHVRFGTLSDYFRLVRERTTDRELPLLAGDFFVYADIFSEGRPAYWSGYYTTRPYWKALARQLEAKLRTAEILYVLALANARQIGSQYRRVLESDYNMLTGARQRLGLFQHHDATTGTSRAYVMMDYGVKLFEGLQMSSEVATRAVQLIVSGDSTVSTSSSEDAQPKMFLYPLEEKFNFYSVPHKMTLHVAPKEECRLVVFNSLAQRRREVVKVTVDTVHVRVVEAPRGSKSSPSIVPFQLEPSWNKTSSIPFDTLPGLFELVFVADLPALSTVVYTLEWARSVNPVNLAATLVYEDARHTVQEHGGTRKREAEDPEDNVIEDKTPRINLRRMARPVGSKTKTTVIENRYMKVELDGPTGNLERITNLGSGMTTIARSFFQAYVSAQFHSGAYLFMPEPRQPVTNVTEGSPTIAVIRGPVSSYAVVLYPGFIQHEWRMYHVGGSLLERALHMETTVEYPPPPKLRETELFFRVVTDINNDEDFFADQNGFQMQRRPRVANVGTEGNYYPATCLTYIEDSKSRLSLVMTRAHGVASLQPGWLELMLDRRTLYDDSRGLGEGVIDNKPTTTKMALIFEERALPSQGAFDARSAKKKKKLSGAAVPRASFLAQALSNSYSYPLDVWAVDGPNSPPLRATVRLISKSFPCHVHLVTLRSLASHAAFELPSRSALFVLHHQSHTCEISWTNDGSCNLHSDGRLAPGTKLKNVQVGSIRRTSLTGVRHEGALASMDQVRVPALEVRAYHVTFQ